MRVFGILILLVTILSTPAAADLSQLVTVLPKCALNCLVKSISESDCLPTNQTCICTDPSLNANVELCVAGSCTVKESLTTKNITSSACGAPIRDRSQVIIDAAVVPGVFAFVIYVLRMVARLPHFGGQIGWDDFTMTLAIALMIPLTVLSPFLAKDGLGKDMWKVSFDNISRILYLYFIDESLYVSIIALTKISILCFYLRIFPKRSFRNACYVVIGLNACYIIVFVLVTIFQCNPIHATWTNWDGEEQAKCNSEHAQGWASAAINIILDITTMALPLPELLKLSLSIKKKIFVLSMFSLGIFVTLVSILRLQSLIQFSNTTNPTWDLVGTGYWSTIEVDVGIICACLPALRSLLTHVFPRAFGGTTRNASYNYGKNSTSRSNNSRLDGPKHHASNTEDFVPLVDMESGRRGM